MPKFEYRIVPAPEKSPRIRGLKGAPLFAFTLEEVMNSLGADGWQYLRAETLPHDERTGLTSRKTTYRNMLIFQREIVEVSTSAAVAVPRPARVQATRPAPPPLSRDPEADMPPSAGRASGPERLAERAADRPDDRPADREGPPWSEDDDPPETALERALFPDRKR